MHLQEEQPANGQTSDFGVRHYLLILGFFGFFTIYATKVDLSVSMVAIANQTLITGTNEACRQLALPSSEVGNTHRVWKKPRGEFNWDPYTQSIILGSFFYGYLVTQVPGGIMADIFGAKWIFGIGVLVTSIFTLLTPTAVRWGVGPVILTRIIEGLGEGVTYPAMNAHIARWAPKTERSLFSTCIFGGSLVGTMVATILPGYLATTSFLGGWPSTFYIFGFWGCVWFVFWICLIYENPSKHPWITKHELNLIKGTQEDLKVKHMKIPWGAILKSKPVWALAITHFAHNYGLNTMLTEIPTFFSDVLHFNIRKNAVISSLPYAVQTIVALIASIVADRMRSDDMGRISTIRKVLNCIGFFGPCLCFFLATVFACKPVPIIFFLCFAMGFNGFTYSGFFATHVDMSPNFAGPLMAITSSVSSISGILAPLFVGKITKSGQTVDNWNLIFYITGCMYLIGGLIYYLFCTADPQPWDSPSNTIRHRNTNSENVVSVEMTRSSPSTSRDYQGMP